MPIARWTNWELGVLKKIYSKVDDRVLDKKIPHRSLGAIHSKAAQLGLRKEPSGTKKQMPNDKESESKVDVPSIDTDKLIENFGSKGDHDNKHYKRFSKIFSANLLEKHGIDLGKVGKKLGAGTAGAAFEYKNGVIKITKDMTEAFSSAAIKGKDIPGVVGIYKVVLFSWSDNKNYRLDSHGDFRLTPMMGFHLALIIQEKLMPLPEKTKLKLQKRFKKFKKYMGEPVAIFLRDYFKKKVSRKSLEKIFTKLWGEPGLYKGFWNVNNNLQKFGVKFYDYHVGNLLTNRAGNITCFDLGYSYTENKEGADVIKLEHLLRELKLRKLVW